MIANNGKEFAPPYFFVEKKIVGTFKECQKVLENYELNDSINRINDLIEQGISILANELDFIDSYILQAYRKN